MKRSNLYKIFLSLVLLVATERFCRSQTKGFRLEKTLTDLPYQKEWEIKNALLTEGILDQPFYFLGSGAECYAFLGKDQTTVLKLFKHYRIGLPSTKLEKLPLFSKWKKQILDKRKKRMSKFFQSAILASQDIPEQTGVFHLKINEGNTDYPTITIYDNIHIAHQLDLNKAPFALQKRAELLFPYLKAHPEETNLIIDSLFACLASCREKQIINTDPRLYQNCGILDGKVIEIDIGSFAYNQENSFPNNK